MQKYFLLFITFFIILGCGYKEGVKTTAAKSYLYFTGFTVPQKEQKTSFSVSIDASEPFSILPGEKNLYAIKPGKHTVKVFKQDKLILQKQIYVSDGVAKEIEVY